MGAIFFGALLGFLAYFIVRAILTGIYTVDQNERAVLTTFGRAERLGGTTLEDPISESLTDEEKQRYAYPQLRVIGPGGPYFKMPWQRVYKVTRRHADAQHRVRSRRARARTTTTRCWRR